MSAGHVLMAFAMTGMFVPRWNVLPVGLWEVVFAVAALWFVAQAGRAVAHHGVGAPAGRGGSHARHYLVHAVMACTMLYAYWLGMPVTDSARTAGDVGLMSGPPTGAGDPGLTLLLMAVLLASAVWQLDALPARRTPLVAAAGHAALPAAPGRVEQHSQPWPASRLEIGCHVAMCLAMAYMLVLVV